MEFLMELPPSFALKHFLESFASSSMLEQDRYSRLKLVYELIYDRLYSIEQLKDAEKLECFQAYCSEYLQAGPGAAEDDERKGQSLRGLLAS